MYLEQKTYTTENLYINVCRCFTTEKLSNHRFQYKFRSSSIKLRLTNWISNHLKSNKLFFIVTEISKLKLTLHRCINMDQYRFAYRRASASFRTSVSSPKNIPKTRMTKNRQNWEYETTNNKFQFRVVLVKAVLQLSRVPLARQLSVVVQNRSLTIC